jgi:glutamate racemase
MATKDPFPIFSHPKMGVIDSGIGGILVLRSLIKAFPATYYYLADLQNLPYGNKSADELIALSIKNVDQLLTYKVDIIVIACHTLSATVLDRLRMLYPEIIFFDVIEPVIRKALAISSYKRIGIMGTSATIASHYHKHLLQQYDPAITVVEQACPTLASLIEHNSSIEIIHNTLSEYITTFRREEIDTLILGCTHYDLIKEIIQQSLNNVSLISAADHILSNLNKSIRILTSQSKASVSFLLTQEKPSFIERAKKLIEFKDE